MGVKKTMAVKIRELIDKALAEMEPEFQAIEEEAISKAEAIAEEVANRLSWPDSEEA
jgi:hypothetical protein